MPAEAPDMVEKIIDDYTGSDYEASNEVTDFLERFENLSGTQRDAIQRALRQKGISTAKGLEAELLRVGPDITADLREPQKPASKPVGQITVKNIGGLLEQSPQNRTVRMLRELSPKDQVKTLKQAGIKLTHQWDASNTMSMGRVEDAIGAVLTGISGKGGKSIRAISTPMGGAARRH